MSEIDWMAIGIAAVGVLVTTGGGLLSLVSDPDRPAKFLPVYLVAICLFCGGLGLILRCQKVGGWVDQIVNPPAKTEETASRDRSNVTQTDYHGNRFTAGKLTAEG